MASVQTGVSSRSPTIQEEEECQLAWHVFIQWLKNKDIMDRWMQDMGEIGIKYNFIFNEHYVSVQDSPTPTHRFQFLQWVGVGPEWGVDNKWKDINDEWNVIGKKLDIYLQEARNEY